MSFRPPRVPLLLTIALALTALVVPALQVHLHPPPTTTIETWQTDRTRLVLAPGVYADNSLPTNRNSRHPNQQSIGRTRIGGLRTVQLGGDADWTCLANESNGGLLVPWYTSVEFSGAAGGWACFSMTIDGVDIAINTTSAVITDGAGNDGLGTCFRMQAGRMYTQILEPSHFVTASTSVLRRDGVCAPDAGPTGAPCANDDECAGVDGGVTCYGGTTDGGTDQIAAGNVLGAYVCWTSGAIDAVHLE